MIRTRRAGETLVRQVNQSAKQSANTFVQLWNVFKKPAHHLVFRFQSNVSRPRSARKPFYRFAAESSLPKPVFVQQTLGCNVLGHTNKTYCFLFFTLKSRPADSRFVLTRVQLELASIEFNCDEMANQLAWWMSARQSTNSSLPGDLKMHKSCYIIFIYLIIDLISFTVILPLVPSLFDYYEENDQVSLGWLIIINHWL